MAERAANRTLQADLIKKFSEATNKETVRDNLKFLTDADLLPDYAFEIRDYLKSNPEAAPLSSTSSRSSSSIDLTFFVAGMMVNTDGICTGCPEDRYHGARTSLTDPITGEVLDAGKLP